MPPLDQLLFIEVLGGGKGESVILRLPDGRWGVVDCYSQNLNSPGSNPTIARLRLLGVDHLEFVGLTHPHDDHYRGMSQILETFPPRRFWQFNGMSRQYLEYLALYLHAEAKARGQQSLKSSVEDLERTFEIVGKRRSVNGDFHFSYMLDVLTLYRAAVPLEDGTLKEIKIQSLAPVSEIVANYQDSLIKCFDNGRLKPNLPNLDHNRLSAALLIEYGETRVVLGGDVKDETWRSVLNSQELFQFKLASDAIKVSHHGSTNGYCDGLWAAFSASGNPAALITPSHSSNLPQESALDHIQEYAEFIAITNGSKTNRQSVNSFTLVPDAPSQVEEMMRADALSATMVTGDITGRCTIVFDSNGNCVYKELANGAVVLV